MKLSFLKEEAAFFLQEMQTIPEIHREQQTLGCLFPMTTPAGNSYTKGLGNQGGRDNSQSQARPPAISQHFPRVTGKQNL